MGCTVAKLALGIPTYQSMPTGMVSNLFNLDRTGVEVTATVVTAGVYVAAAMRGIRDELLEKDPNFERLLIIEADMMVPRDTLIRHAAHTEPIVGGVYFMHAPPHHPIFTAPADEVDYHRLFNAVEVAEMLEKPGLYEAMNVGFGCTSIRRDVLEEWPSNLPMFCNRQGLTADGMLVEMGHDVAFCLEARRFGWKSYVDTNIVCGHLTQTVITPDHFLRANGQTLPGEIRDHDKGTQVSMAMPEMHPHPLRMAAKNLDIAGVPSGEQVAAHASSWKAFEHADAPA